MHVAQSPLVGVGAGGARVEVSVDEGGTWSGAELEDEGLGDWAWRAWTFTVDASEPG